MERSDTRLVAELASDVVLGLRLPLEFALCLVEDILLLVGRKNAVLERALPLMSVST